MKLKKILALILSVAMMTSGAAVFAEEDDSKTETADTEAVVQYSEEYLIIELIAKYVSDLYIDDSYDVQTVINKGLSEYVEGDSELMIAILKSMLESMDDYSEFFTYDEYRQYMNTMNQTFYGIGVTLQSVGEYVEIAGFAEENSAAEQAGFKVGDKIVAVDGVDVVGWSMTNVRLKIVGDLGTTVNITVLRDGERIDLTGTRIAVTQSTVTGGILEGNIGYVKITSFGTSTLDEYLAVSKELADNGVEKVILDLRDNPGGLVTAATGIAQQIVPKGKIIDIKYRDEKQNLTYYSELEKPTMDFYVLINENTASSSEILASAIQDSGAGVLIGTESYGKAVVQQSFQLNNGSVIKLTIGQYITRNGNTINGVGLTPDNHVTNYSEIIDSTQYTQFDYATQYSIGDNGTNVIAAKERLNLLGYYSGNVSSSVFNEELRSVIKKFQEENDLVSNGVLDIPTQVKLQEKFSALEKTVDRQLQAAYEMCGGEAENLYAKSE